LLGRELRVAPPERTIDLYRLLAIKGVPAIVSRTPQPYHIPAETTPFIGYQAELAYVQEYLALKGGRLLTVTGPNGSGKTRLALRAAWAELPNFQHGVFFVDLISTKREQIFEAIAAVLPMPAVEPGQAKRQLLAWLKDKEILLVLNHFDHLVKQAYMLLDLLYAAPRLSLVVTSTAWLKVRGETVLPLRGLQCPAEGRGEAVEQYEAVQFFCQIARQWKPDFKLVRREDRLAVARLCQLVGGLPLALELAAYWVSLYSPAEIVEKVAASTNLLATPLRHLPQRRRSMTNLFVSVWMQLSAPEQQALSRLSVFRGGFTLEAAEKVAQTTPATLMALHSKSLLQAMGQESQVEGEQTRRYQIPELFRRYSEELLKEQSPAAQTIQYTRHCHYYLNVLHQQAADLYGGQAEAAVQTILGEVENIEQAWEWSLGQQLYDRVAVAQHDLVAYYTLSKRWQDAVRVMNQAMGSLGSAAMAAAGPLLADRNQT
jgi:predicted ATPase